MFLIIPRFEHNRKQFLSVFHMCRTLSVLLGQDYTAKTKTSIVRTCGKSTENQRNHHHCINPWCSRISNIACQYFFILGIPEDTYFTCIFIHSPIPTHIHTCIFTIDIHTNTIQENNVADSNTGAAPQWQVKSKNHRHQKTR